MDFIDQTLIQLGMILTFNYIFGSSARCIAHNVNLRPEKVTRNPLNN